MHINDFSEFDMVKGVFVVDATVWFRFNPSLISLDRIKRFTFDKAEMALILMIMVNLELFHLMSA